MSIAVRAEREEDRARRYLAVPSTSHMRQQWHRPWRTFRPISRGPLNRCGAEAHAIKSISRWGSGLKDLAVTLLTWNLDTSGEPRLVGAIEIQITGADRVVRTQVVKESEPVSAELPGNVAASAGRLLHRLASEGVMRVTR